RPREPPVVLGDHRRPSRANAPLALGPVCPHHPWSVAFAPGSSMAFASHELLVRRDGRERAAFRPARLPPCWRTHEPLLHARGWVHPSLLHRPPSSRVIRHVAADAKLRCRADRLLPAILHGVAGGLGRSDRAMASDPWVAAGPSHRTRCTSPTLHRIRKRATAGESRAR